MESESEPIDPFSFEAIAEGAVPSSLPFLNSNPNVHATQDTVTYAIYVPLPAGVAPSSSAASETTKRAETEDKPDEPTERIVGTSVRTQLSAIKAAATKLQRETPELAEYIWHHQSFGLDLRWDGATWLLEGKTSIADAIADEWLIVWILVQLSKQFPDAWIRVFDLDGEFLAAEGAEHMPDWLAPDHDLNRIWLNSGEIKLVKVRPGESNQQLLITEALGRLSSTTNLYTSSKLTKAALSRIPSDASKIRNNLHRSIAIIPRRLAWIIRERPGTISSAVEAFYLRDPVSTRNLRRRAKKADNSGSDEIAVAVTETKSGSLFAITDLVSCPILFNRVGFAQLHSQEVSIPAAWADAVNEVRSRAQGEDKAKSMKELEMGIKVTMGYDLLADPAKRDTGPVREIEILLQDLDDGDVELPTDEEVAGWLAGQGADDEQWMNIDWRDFEAELAGKNTPATRADVSESIVGTGSGSTRPAGSTETPDVGTGFGDKAAQQNLRRIVERTRAFLEDESAGLDGFNIDGDGQRQRKKPKPTPTAPMDLAEWLAQSSDEDDDDDGSDGSYHSDDDDDGSIARDEGHDSDADSQASSVDSAEFDAGLRDMLQIPPHYELSAGTGRPVFGPDPPPGFRNIDGRTVVRSVRLREMKRDRDRRLARVERNPNVHLDSHIGDEDDDADDVSQEDDDEDDVDGQGDIHPDSKYHRLVNSNRAKIRNRPIPPSARMIDFPEDEIILKELDRSRDERVRERNLIRQRLRDARQLRQKEGVDESGDGVDSQDEEEDDGDGEGQEYHGDDGDGGDLQLAQNLLESLHSQPGAPGPTANLLSMLGLPTPVPVPEDTES